MFRGIIVSLMLVAGLMIGTQAHAQNVDWEYPGYWIGTSWSINLPQGTQGVGAAIHACYFNNQGRFACDAYGRDRLTGHCVRKGDPYYGRVIKTGYLSWLELDMHWGPEEGIVPILINGDGDFAVINLVTANNGKGVPIPGFLETNVFVRAGAYWDQTIQNDFNYATRNLCQ